MLLTIIHRLLPLPCDKRTSLSRACTACSNSTLGVKATPAAPGRGGVMFVAQGGLRGIEKTPSKAKASPRSCQGYNLSPLCCARGSQSPSQEVVPCFGCKLSCRESQNPMDCLEGTTVTTQVIWLSLPGQQGDARARRTG